MIKYLAIIILFVFSGCKDCADYSQADLVFEKKYECIESSPIQNKNDTLIHFIAYCSDKKFEEALKLFLIPSLYKVIGSWRITEGLDTTKFKYYSINDFPYTDFSSNELFMFSQYFYKKYDCKKELVDRLLRESLKKDSLNFFSLYNLLVLSSDSKEYDYSTCLINYLKEHKMLIGDSEKIESDVTDNIRNENLTIKKINSIAEILDSPVFVYDFQEGYFENKGL